MRVKCEVMVESPIPEKIVTVYIEEWEISAIAESNAKGEHGTNCAECKKITFDLTTELR